jgi:hypothetical protein
MGAKAAKLKDRDVPAHNPLVNNDFVRMHYFKDREESKETEIRQENHFILINKNGVVDDGRTLVGLRKRDHKGKIYFIKRRPKKFGPQQDTDSQDSASENMSRLRKFSDSDQISQSDQLSQSDQMSLPDHQMDQSANMFDSHVMNENHGMLQNEHHSDISDEEILRRPSKAGHKDYKPVEPAHTEEDFIPEEDSGEEEDKIEMIEEGENKLNLRFKEDQEGDEEDHEDYNEIERDQMHEGEAEEDVEQQELEEQQEVQEPQPQEEEEEVIDTRPKKKKSKVTKKKNKKVKVEVKPQIEESDSSDGNEIEFKNQASDGD